MKIHWEYLVSAALAIVTLLLMWFLPPAITQKASDIMILRASILALGGLGIGGLLWWAASKRQGTAVAASAVSIESDTTQKVSGGGGGSTEDIDLLIREAQQQLTSSRLGKGATLGNLPAIFLVGESGSGKTSAILHSGIEPELLAGHAFQEGAVVPTRAANFWLARRTVFAEAGGRLLKDSARWARLVKKLAPSKLHSVFGRKQQAPRGAVVCLDCEAFTKAGAQDAVAAIARTLRGRLGEISQLLGISFPLYVVFTRADRLPFFTEFARPLASEEASQVFGTTLGLSAAAGTGVYAEQETKRLSTSFNTLFHSLADWRVPLLSRERDAANQPGVYEFPREFRKLRSLAVQFLVELCRPSQLRTAPFLRGFYFAGMRKTLQATGPAAGTQTMVAQSPFQGASRPESATRMMSMADAQKMLEAEASARGGGGGEMREVTQPVFLGHLFSHVILQDQAALGASGASTKVSGLQRGLLTLTAIVAGILCLFFLVSFFANRAMEARVTDAAKAAARPDLSAVAVPFDPAQPPSMEALQKLDGLRVEIEQLNAWKRDGAPWYMRWGLYAGDAVLPHARRAYFNRFHDLMFGQTQEAMRATLSRLPASPGPTDECAPYYDQLKAYLITTSHPDKSTREWLPPVLQQYWPAGKGLEEDRRKLSYAQFDFYSEELKVKNPFSPEVDAPTVERARGYLSRCAATDQVYRAMKADVGKKVKSFNFNRNYPDSVGVVTNSMDVEGAFLKDGWTLMQEAIRNPAKYIGGERWVLGEQVAVSVDLGRLETELRARYLSDFIKTWRDVMAATSIVGYGSLRDAAQKLLKHVSNQPPLIVLFCEVSHNTSVDNPDVQKAFAAVQQVEPAACKPSGTPIQPPNAPYVQALLQLQGLIEQASTAPPDQEKALKAQAFQALTPTRTAARQVAQALKPDPDAKLDRRIGSLMDDTIAKLDPVLKEDSGEGGLCSAFRMLKEKYPFTLASRTPASMDDLLVFFTPVTGHLSKWYEARKDTFSTSGTMYANNPAGTVRYSGNFLRFFNEAMAIQRALFPGNSPVMRYQFSIRQGPIEGAQAVQVSIYGTPHVFGVGVPSPKQFDWPGTGSDVSMSAVLAGGSTVGVAGPYSGPWAFTQMLQRADRVTPMGNGVRIERLPTSGNPPEPIIGIGGRPIRIILDADSGGAPFIFRPGFFSGMTCSR